MVKFKKFAVRGWLGMACALNPSSLGNILMHHTRIEVQKAYFQYIKVEPNAGLFIPCQLSFQKEIIVEDFGLGNSGERKNWVGLLC
jgi:hypothetical protein